MYEVCMRSSFLPKYKRNIVRIWLIWWWHSDILRRLLKFVSTLLLMWFQKKSGRFFSNFVIFSQFLNFMKFLPCLDWCQWLFASLKFVWQNLNRKALFYPFSIYSVCASWSYEFVSFGKSFLLFASLLVPFSSLQRKNVEIVKRFEMQYLAQVVVCIN